MKTKPIRELAREHWPHPGPYGKVWFGCRTCGYHWFPVDAGKEPTRCPKCERELEGTRRLTGIGVPEDTRALALCKCYRCGFEWFWRKRVPMLPRYCGNIRCTSPYWGSPRVLAPGLAWSKSKRGKAAHPPARPKKKLPTRRVLRDGISDHAGRAGGGGLLL